jgi:transcriptional regulator with XRE-family HTH domain
MWGINNPHKEFVLMHIVEMRTNDKISDVLAKNLVKLMRAHPSLNTLDALEKKTGIGGSTIDRIKKGQVSTSIDNVSLLADAYSVSPAAMITPDGVDQAAALPLEAVDIVEMMKSTDDRGRKNILLAASYAFDEHQAHMRKINAEPLREVSQFTDEEIRIIVGYRNANAANRSLILGSSTDSDQQDAPKEAKKK